MDTLGADIEAVIAYAADVPRDDDVLWHRMVALVSPDPSAALAAGEALLASSDPDRREIGADLIGMAAELDRGLRERALGPLRRILAEEAKPGPLSAAITKLGHQDDLESHDAVLALARHPDPLVRNAVAFALPSVGLDGAALAALRDLSRDEDEDVRDWATFGLGTQSEADDEPTREALFARVEDPHYDTRIEGIVGLALRGDEQVRPHLERELENPDGAPDCLREAAEHLAPLLPPSE